MTDRPPTEGPRLVADANIFISAFLFRGKPARILDLIDDGSILLIHSTALRVETERILKEKFRWSAAEIERACAEYWSGGLFVTPTVTIRECVDPHDDYLLECAIEGQAQFIVTGDKDLLRMRSFRGCEILAPAAFLSRMHLPR